MTTTRTTIKPLHPMAASVRFDVSNEDRFRRNLEQWAAEITNAIAVDPLGASGAGELPIGVAVGDLLYGSAADTWSRRAIGTTGYWLRAGTTPGWQAPSALTRVDDTNVTLVLGGSPTTALLNAASLTLGWTGQLSVARGGTGAATLTSGSLVVGQGTSAVAFLTAAAGDLIYGSGAGTWSKLAANATGTNKFLRDVSSGAPSWEQVAFADLSGTLTYAQLPSAATRTWALGGDATFSGGYVFVDANKGVKWVTDNTAGGTVGVSGANRPLGVYVGTEVVVGTDPDGVSGMSSFVTAGRPLRMSGAPLCYNGFPMVLRTDANEIFRGVGIAQSPTIVLFRANGTLASPSGVVTGNILGHVQWFSESSTLTTLINVASISAVAREDHTTSVSGTLLRFGLTAVGANASTNRVRLAWSDFTTDATVSQESQSDMLFIYPTGTAGSGNYGSVIGAANLGASTTAGNSNIRKAAIAIRQTTADVDQVGWSFFVHDSATAGTALSELARFSIAGDLDSQFFGSVFSSSIFGTNTAANTVLVRNSVTQLTLASLAATFAGTCTATEFLAPTFDSGSAVDMVLQRNNVTQLTLGSLAATFAGTCTATEFLGPTLDSGSGVDLVLQRNNVTQLTMASLAATFAGQAAAQAMISLTTPTTDITLPANSSVVVVGPYTIGASITVTVPATSTLLVL